MFIIRQARKIQLRRMTDDNEYFDAIPEDEAVELNNSRVADLSGDSFNNSVAVVDISESSEEETSDDEPDNAGNHRNIYVAKNGLEWSKDPTVPPNCRTLAHNIFRSTYGPAKITQGKCSMD